MPPELPVAIVLQEDSIWNAPLTPLWRHGYVTNYIISFSFHRSLPFLREIKAHKNSVDQKFNTSFSVGVSMHCVCLDKQLPWKILQNRNILHLRHVFMVTYLNHLCTCGLFFCNQLLDECCNLKSERTHNMQFFLNIKKQWNVMLAFFQFNKFYKWEFGKNLDNS